MKFTNIWAPKSPSPFWTGCLLTHFPSQWRLYWMVQVACSMCKGKALCVVWLVWWKKHQQDELSSTVKEKLWKWLFHRSRNCIQTKSCQKWTHSSICNRNKRYCTHELLHSSKKHSSNKSEIWYYLWSTTTHDSWQRHNVYVCKTTFKQEYTS